MARFLWLPDVLRAAGLTVVEYPGWRTRGLDRTRTTVGIVCHGTGGSLTSTDAGEIRTIAVTGSATAAAPIAELYQSRTGTWFVLASGVCTGVKTGTGGPLKGHGDASVLQVEAQHNGAEAWSEVQYRSYVRGVAALQAHKAPGYDVPLAHVIGHGEHQPGEKTDPWFDMNRFRLDVQAVLNGEDMGIYDDDHGKAAVWRLEALVAGRESVKDGPSKGEPVQVIRTVNRLAADVAKLATPVPPVTPEQFEAIHERVMRKILGAADGAVPPTAG